MTPLIHPFPPYLSKQIALVTAAKHLHAAIKERGKLSEEQSYECAILLIEWNCSQYRLDEWTDAYVVAQAREKVVAQAREKAEKLPLAPELQQALEAVFLMISNQGVPPEKCQQVAANLIVAAIVKSADAPTQAAGFVQD